MPYGKLDFIVLLQKEVEALSHREIDCELQHVDANIDRLSSMLGSQLETCQPAPKYIDFASMVREHKDLIAAGNEQEARVVAHKLKGMSDLVQNHIRQQVSIADMRNQLDRHLEYRKSLIYARIKCKQAA